jgi:archaellum biogenesis ATPase FlaH
VSDDWLSGQPMDPAAAPVEPLPTLAGFPFVPEGNGVMIVGPTGGGRSALVQAALYDAGLAGLDCAYLGSEITPGEFNARAAVLADRRGDTINDEIRGRLSLVRYLDLASVIASAWARTDEWANAIVGRYTVVVIDPISAVASALDLDFDKANADYIKFYDRLVAPLTSRGVAVILVDNVGHAEEAKARAKGASAKSDRADLTFSCSQSTNPPGLIIKAGKVRSVRAGFQRGDEWLFLKDPQRIVARGHSEETHPAFRPTTIMQRVSEAVERDPGLSANAIRTTIGGRSEYVTLALQLLVSEGYIDAERDGQAHRHRSLKPYTTPTASTESPPSPNQVPDPVLGTESTESLLPSRGLGNGPSHNGDGHGRTESIAGIS